MKQTISTTILILFISITSTVNSYAASLDNNFPEHLTKQLNEDIQTINERFEKNEALEQNGCWNEADYIIDMRRCKLGEWAEFITESQRKKVNEYLADIKQKTGIPYYVVLLSVMPQKSLEARTKNSSNPFASNTRALFQKYNQAIKEQSNIQNSYGKNVLLSVGTFLTLKAWKNNKSGRYAEIPENDYLKKEKLDEFWYGVDYQSQWYVTYGEEILFGPAIEDIIIKNNYDIRTFWNKAIDHVNGLSFDFFGYQYADVDLDFTSNGKGVNEKYHRGKVLSKYITATQKTVEYFEEGGFNDQIVQSLFIEKLFNDIAIANKNSKDLLNFDYKLYGYKGRQSDTRNKTFDEHTAAWTENEKVYNTFYHNDQKIQVDYIEKLNNTSVSNIVALNISSDKIYHQEFLDEGYLEAGFTYYTNEGKKALTFKFSKINEFSNFLNKIGLANKSKELTEKYRIEALKRLNDYSQYTFKYDNEVNNLVNFIEDAGLNELSLDAKIRMMITVFRKEWLGETVSQWFGDGLSENSLIKIINSISDEEFPTFQEKLMSSQFKDVDGRYYRLFNTLIKEYSDIKMFIDDDNYARIMDVFTEKTKDRFESSAKDALKAKLTQQELVYNLYRVGRKKGFVKNFSCRVNEETGFIEIAPKVTVTDYTLDYESEQIETDWDKKITLHPFNDYVVANPNEDTEFGLKKGITQPIPAITLYYFGDQYENIAIGKKIEMTADVLSLALGFGAIRGPTLAGRAFAYLSISNTLANMTTSHLSDQLVSMGVDQKTVDDIQRFTTWVDLVGLGLSDLPTLVRKFDDMATTLAKARTQAQKSSKFTKGGTLDEGLTAYEQIANNLKNGNISSVSTEVLTTIGKKINDLPDPPTGYHFYTLNDQKWIRRADAKNVETPKLTVKNGNIVYAEGDWLRVADDALDLSGDVKLSDVQDLLKANGVFETKAGSEYLDVIIHGSGDKFLINGKLIDNNDLPLALSEYTGKVRLLSCASLESAKDLAIRLNKEVVATPGLVRIHTDGFMSVAPNKGSPTDWFSCKADGSQTKLNITSQQSAYPDDYLELGKSPKKVGDLEKMDQVFDLSKNSRMNELLKKRSIDGNKLNVEELAELNKLQSEVPKLYPVTLDKAIAEFPDVPLDKEFTQKIKVKFTDPQLPSDPKHFNMQFKLENNSIKGIKEGYYDYVITMDGKLKIGGGHYYLSNSNEYVKAAGQININSIGKIKTVDPHSGHYQPNYNENEVARELFRELGLFTE